MLSPGIQLQGVIHHSDTPRHSLSSSLCHWEPFIGFQRHRTQGVLTRAQVPLTAGQLISAWLRQVSLPWPSPSLPPATSPPQASLPSVWARASPLVSQTRVIPDAAFHEMLPDTWCHRGTEKGTGIPACGIHCFFAWGPLLHYQLLESGETDL